MAAQQSAGIATLLEAEKEASKVVQVARQYRTQKLKDARSEAAKEIETYKAKKEEEFKQYEKEHAGSSTSSQSTIDTSTEQSLSTLRSSFSTNRPSVVQKLLDRVVLVKPELHRNLTKLEA
ncbi:H+-ATPase G subunit-domain-containing protein [Mrakia frigida]|uniref:H(+)-transporting V1 sector ATPase subunit G n=1 Tax=Mrakia frigida TaxID=29902 RepID=UPI003FCBFD2C